MKRILLIGGLLCALLFGLYVTFDYVRNMYHDALDYVAKTTTKSLERTIKENKIITYHDFDYSWVNGQKTVMHAFGSIEDNDYTNSLEAFQYNYSRGSRIFEVDLRLTDDYKLVCCHDADDWRKMSGIEDGDFNYDIFMNSSLFGKYTVIDIKDLLKIMDQHKDIYIITDTKDYDEDLCYVEFQTIVNNALEINPEVLDRIIPQIYTENMVQNIMEIYPFKSVIFTLYQIEWSPESVASFCSESGVGLITVNYQNIEENTIDLWRSFGITIAVHTVNSKEEALKYFNSGVSLIYTDDLIDSDLYLNN